MSLTASGLNGSMPPSPRPSLPGDRVADLGCGSGILGLLCLRAGAGQVFGIDSTAMIEVARETFLRAGLAGRGDFIHGHSHRVELREPVDLVICDHVGYFGFDYGIVAHPGGCPAAFSQARR